MITLAFIMLLVSFVANGIFTLGDPRAYMRALHAVFFVLTGIGAYGVWGVL